MSAASDRLALFLYVCFLFYVFVGTSPLADVTASDAANGSPIERAAVISLTLLAVLVGLMRARSTLVLMRRTWLIWLLLAWFCASVAWSAHPDLSLRRTGALVLVAVICLPIAASLRSLRGALGPMVAVLAVAMAADFAVTALRPDFAITDLGVRGYHAQKNVAGLTAMLAVIVTLGWTLTARGIAQVIAGLAALALCASFLAITDSKTSLTLAALAVVATLGLLVLRRLPSGVTVLVVGFVLGSGVVALTTAAAFETDLVALLTPGGDVTFTGRTEIWDLANAEIARRPWTGFGYGAFWDVGADDDPLRRAPAGSWLSQVKDGATSGIVINEAHNGYLDVRLQAGLPALALALAILAQTILALARRCLSRDQPPGEAVAAVTLLVFMLVFLIHNVTESSLWARGQALTNISILVAFLAMRLPTIRRPAIGLTAPRRSGEAET